MTTQDHLSDFAFDRLMTGELEGSDLPAAIRAHVDACPACAAREAELAREAQAFVALRAARPAPALGAAAAGAAGRRARPRVLFATLTAVAAVAAALLVVARPPATDERTLKGPALVLDAFVRRTGGAVDALLPGARVAPGDRLRFEVAAPFDGFLALVSADGAGNVTSYLPGDAAALLPVRAGRHRSLDGSVELDGVLGNERVFAFLCRERLDGRGLLAAVRAALASAGGDAKRATIAASPASAGAIGACATATTWFEKVPAP